MFEQEVIVCGLCSGEWWWWIVVCIDSVGFSYKVVMRNYKNPDFLVCVVQQWLVHVCETKCNATFHALYSTSLL